MSRTMYRILSAILVVLSAAVLAGCSKASGGGWLPSATGNGKATFGFTGKCKDAIENGAAIAKISAQLEYKDAAAKVQLHGTVQDSGSSGTCAEVQATWDAPGSSTFVGSYRPQPGGTGGMFFLTVTDAGEPGLKGDSFCLSLLDGAYSGYSNCGPIGGGNIQVR